MDRRVVGGLVLIMALVAALAGNVRTKHIGGAAVPSAVPAQPSVGECVLGPLWTAAAGAPAVVTSATGLGYAQVNTGPCPAMRFGEVVGIVPDGMDYRAPVGVDPDDDPASPQNQCTARLSDYLGTAADAGDPRRWSPSPWVQVGMSAPSETQRAAGRRWLICSTLTLGPAGGEPRRYTGSTRDMMRSLKFPPELAQCLPVAPVGRGYVTVDCAQPHRAELFALASSEDPDPTIERDWTTRCPPMVKAMTGLTTRAAGGGLQVRAVVLRSLPSDNYASEPTGPLPLTAFCLVETVGSRVLSGPLLGLGDGPLPLR